MNNPKQSVSATSIPEMVAMWTDVFNFQKKYYNAPPERDSIESTEFYQSLTAESSQIMAKYDNSKLCGGIILAVIEDIGKRAAEVM